MKAIRQLKNHKAPGGDDLFPEMFKVEKDKIGICLDKVIL